MLGVILLYVGMVLMSNGLHRLEGIPDKSNVVMNIFTGGLGLILNIIVIAYGACTGQGAEWFYGSATGLLFAFTYLYSAINTIFDFDQRLICPLSSRQVKYLKKCLFLKVSRT